MNTLGLIAVSLCVLMLSYRYYAAFLATKVLLLDPNRMTPAHQFNDGRDYHPTNKLVLFGHHFAAIAGAGPLIGPVLAAQYGWGPGAIWILVGAVFAGAVQDMIILWASVRQKGESLGQIARNQVSTVSGWATTFAILVHHGGGVSRSGGCGGSRAQRFGVGQLYHRRDGAHRAC